jgi:glycosyltransferase involved in cell wall biosynthesis
MTDSAALTSPRRVLIIGSHILGNATASRRFKEAIESIPATETTYIAIDQGDIDSSRLPARVRRFQLVPTYLSLRARLCELANLQPDFDLIFVVTCQPLTALHGLWRHARVALWFDGLPHHPGNGTQAYLLNSAVQFVYGYAFARVQYLLPMSKWAEQQASRFAFPHLRCTLISPTRVSRQVWSNPNPRRAAPGEVINVLLVGNNANGKGFIDFFRWCDAEEKDLSQFRFTIVSNEGNITLKQVTENMPVTFVEDLTHGDIRRLVAIYHRSHLFFLPTKADMMPNVLIEAAASGLPCIASRLGAIDEVVVHDRTGWLVAPQHWDLFYERLQAFAANPTHFSSDALSAHAEQFFDERMRDDLHRILSNSGGAHARS